LRDVDLFATGSGAGNDVSDFIPIYAVIRLDYYIFKGYGVRPVRRGPTPICNPIRRCTFAVEIR
jgi:hypothetical protein